jgi:hypothetical protein
MALAKKYSLSKKIESSLVNYFWNEAKKESESFDTDVENFLGNWEKTPERLYAQKIVNECLKREIQI